MDISSVLTILVIGLIIGFSANMIMGSEGLGLLWAIVLGLIGSVIGNVLLNLFGYAAHGLPLQIAVGVIGACILIYIARKLRQA